MGPLATSAISLALTLSAVVLRDDTTQGGRDEQVHLQLQQLAVVHALALARQLSVLLLLLVHLVNVEAVLLVDGSLGVRDGNNDGALLLEQLGNHVAGVSKALDGHLDVLELLVLFLKV